MVYLSILYNTQAPRPMTGVYSTGTPLYMLFRSPLCTLFGNTIIYMTTIYHIYISYRVPSPWTAQGMPGGCSRRRQPNLEGGHPNWVTKVSRPKMYFAFSRLFMAVIIVPRQDSESCDDPASYQLIFPDLVIWPLTRFGQCRTPGTYLHYLCLPRHLEISHSKYPWIVHCTQY